MDSNNDGIGDFQGLMQRLDHLSELGITCLWLLPFYPSPNGDNGYDVMDYCNIDPRLGSLGDFIEFMHQAQQRRIRVLVDLVVNRTSIQHPWFQKARSDRHSRYRNYYVWSEQPMPHPNLIAFPTVEASLWEYDEQAKAYYLHHFYKEQPDLNLANPAVQEEICEIMRFWLALGVSGFRIDAAPFMINNVGLESVSQKSLQTFLEVMRSFLTSHRGDAVLLAEANVEPDQLSIFFAQGDRMHLLFDFFLNQYFFLAMARQDSTPLWEALKILPTLPAPCQWLNFVRHHDELALDRLSGSERQEVFDTFAPQETMQIFGRGIRCRLPPMMHSDIRRVQLAYSLMFSLPGTPMLRYGDEIGMGDNLSLKGRTSVRTPMQWSDALNGGFSSAKSEVLTRPVIAEGKYSYHHVNVAAAQRNPASVMHWMERLIRVRKHCPELGYGTLSVVDTDHLCVFAHCCKWDDKAVLCVHNLADRACTVQLQSEQYTHLSDLLGNCQYESVEGGSNIVALSAYGYRWFRLNQTS